MEKPSFDNSWLQRESEASVETPPVYPFNKSRQTESGHLFEMDDTKDRERIRLQHGGAKTNGIGTYFEIHSDGDMTTNVIKDNYQIIAGKNNVSIKGVCNITIEGDSIVHVKGSKYERIDGDYIQEVRGNCTRTVVGEHTINSLNDTSINVGNPDSIVPNGALYLRAADYVMVDSDLQVEGSISGDMVTAKTKVNGGTQVTAGPLGFVSESGGLSVGFPVATPLTVKAGVLVTAPMIRDAIGSMFMMRVQFNTHNHMAFKGPTSFPLRYMI